MNDGPVLIEARHKRILELVATRGQVRIGELARLFGAAERTIRKDLVELDRRGLLRRTHGGALAVKPLVELDLEDRAEQDAEQKDAVGRACLGEINDGDAVFLGAGTTVQRIAHHLAAEGRAEGRRNLTVLTNALEVARTLADQPGIDHVLLGGRLRRASGCVVGALTQDELERFTVNVAFIGVSAFSEDGVSVAHIDEARVAAAAIDRARRTVVPVIRNKVGASHFAKICDLSRIDTVVVDRADDDLRALCEEKGLRVVNAGENAGPAADQRPC